MDTFVDPNGDALKYSTNSLPSWLSFNPSRLQFTGVPNTYGQFTVKLTATDNWGSSTSVSFVIYTGLIVTTPPSVGTLLVDKEAYEK